MRQAFSLLELLVVLTIVGVISSIGVVVYSDHYESSRKSAALSTLNLVISAYKSMRLLDSSIGSTDLSNRGRIEAELFSNSVRLYPLETDFRVELSGGSVRFRATDADGGWQLCLDELFQTC